MSSSDKSKRALGRWAIIIALVLMLAFLMSVATVSGASPSSCKDKYSVLKKSPVQSSGTEGGQWVKVCVNKRLGVAKWAYKWKDCKYGFTYKIFYDYDYCYKTKKCILLSSAPTDPIGTWKQCTSRVAYFTYPIGYTPSGSPI